VIEAAGAIQVSVEFQAGEWKFEQIWIGGSDLECVLRLRRGAREGGLESRVHR